MAGRIQGLGAGLAAVVLALAPGPQDKTSPKGDPPKGKASRGAPAPPKSWKEHWFEHDQAVKLVDFNDEVAVYFDDGMKPGDGSDWIAPFMTRAWRYTKATYGPFGDPRGRLFAIFHQGRYSGGHPSTYLDESHDRRNVTDCGTGSWSPRDVDLPSHEIGHIVEGASRGVRESPAFDLWHDSKWIELYQYDLYIGLGMKEDAERVFAKFSATTDDFPRTGTHWFRDFFFPAWRDYGRSKLMPRFFRLLAEHFPKDQDPSGVIRYTRKLNWGEFVHFLSAAANRDLRPLARKAFGWPSEWEAQFQQARGDFPALTYAAPARGK